MICRLPRWTPTWWARAEIDQLPGTPPWTILTTNLRRKHMKKTLLLATVIAFAPAVWAESIAGLWNATVNLNGESVWRGLPHAAATLARQLSVTVQRKVRREFSKKHLATIRPSALKYRHAARRPCQNRLFPPRLGEGDQPGINSWFGPQYEFSSKAFLLNELGISTQTKQRSMSSRCKTAAVFAASAVAAAWLTCGAAFAGDSPANKAVLVEADTILGQMQASRYSHKTEVDAGKGIFNVDCSGLVRLILKRAAPASLAQIESKS